MKKSRITPGNRQLRRLQAVDNLFERIEKEGMKKEKEQEKEQKEDKGF